MVNRLRIYVAGPYTAPDHAAVWENVVAAIDAGIEIYKRGHYPLIPHLTHFVEQRSQETGAGLKWEDYLVWDRAWLSRCDAFLHLAPSRGADLELAWAKDMGLRIFRNVDEIPPVPEPHVDAAFRSELSHRAAARKARPG